MWYIVALVILIAIYVLALVFLPRCKHPSVVNAILIGVCLSCYLALVLIVYRDVGYADWNFQNVLPTANVSPFMFSSLVIYIFLPKEIKKYWSVLISLLSAGMLGAATIECVTRAVIRYDFHFHFLLDYVAHLSLSLLGVYLVKSGQVEFRKRGCLISGGALLSVALIMLIVNAILDTAYFGLALDEKYNIYNNVLAPNAYLSAVLYFVGVVTVMTIGYFYVKLLTSLKIPSPKSARQENVVEAQNTSLDQHDI